MGVLVTCVLVITVFLYCFVYIYIYSFMLLFNFVSYVFYCYVYVFLFLCVFCCVYSVYILRSGTLRLPSVVSQTPGYNSQRRSTPRTFPKLIVFYSVSFCVNVYCTTATGC